MTPDGVVMVDSNGDKWSIYEIQYPHEGRKFSIFVPARSLADAMDRIDAAARHANSTSRIKGPLLPAS